MEKHLFEVVVEKDADGYFAYCPSLQGCYTQGRTYEEALENIRDAIDPIPCRKFPWEKLHQIIKSELGLP
jgi:hypothetical protein